MKALSLIALTLTLPLSGLSVSAAPAPVGTVIAVSGPFIAIAADSPARLLAKGAALYPGDRLWTGAQTKAQVRFTDGALLTLCPDTELRIDEYRFDENELPDPFSPRRLAKSNAELVARVAAVSAEFERRPASPAEARTILGLAAA